MGLECMICFHKLLPRQNNTFATTCGHIFHNKCIQEWIALNQSCPHCRKPNPNVFQIFLDVAESDNDYQEPQCKLQNELLSARISDLSNELKDNKKQFDDLYGMIEQITISVSSFEVHNQELRRENGNLQKLLEAKSFEDSQRQLNNLDLNGSEAKENNPRTNFKLPPAGGSKDREQKTLKSLTLRFDDMNQKVIIEKSSLISS